MNEEPNRIHFDATQLSQFIDEPQVDPDEAGEPPTDKGGEPNSIEDIRFDIKPLELIGYLKNYVVGQDKAVEIIATKICTHFHRMALERKKSNLPRIVGNVKSNILLIGPTGVGKTYLIRLIANKLNVPFVKGDATKFSETGYVGGDVEDLVRELVHQVDENIKLAEYGIIYLDEIDKIASSGGGWSGPDVSRSGVQRNLLKLMEETEVDLKVPHDLASQMEAVMETQRTGKASRKKINTRNILFVMSGAFMDMPQLIARRLQQGGMGFSDNEMTSVRNVGYLLSHLQSEDLIQYGFESEFVGRLPVVSYLNELDEEGLYQILKNVNSSVIQSKLRDFTAYGIELSFDDATLRLIAKEANRYKTGARGLIRVMERLLLPFERTLPSVGVKRLHVTEEMFSDPEGSLRGLIPKYAVEHFVAEFKSRSGITLEFSPAALQEIAAGTETNSGSIAKYLNDKLKDYEYGLKLAGKDTFMVTLSVLKEPKSYLDKLIKASYGGVPAGEDGSDSV